MNKGKVGAPFEYSYTHIQFLAFLKIGFKISYRTVQGIIRGLYLHPSQFKMSNNHGSYAARFNLDTRPPPDGLAKEHCMANRVQIEKIERHRDEQVRIEFPTAKGPISAIYTVSVFHNGDADLVLLGRKIKNQLQNCQLSNNACKGERGESSS